MLSKETIIGYLKEVKDPEIPVISLVDLGVIRDIDISPESVTVEVVPTFSGCPAMDFMVKEVEEKLLEKGVANPIVNLNSRKSWSSDNLTEEGRAALKKFGLALPGKTSHLEDIDLLEQVNCPHCDSTNTRMESMFGPTLCRSIYYCNNCLQSFERFKTL